MTLPKLDNDRFVPERGLRIIVQVPDSHAQRIVDAVLAEDALKYQRGFFLPILFRSTQKSLPFY